MKIDGDSGVQATTKPYPSRLSLVIRRRAVVFVIGPLLVLACLLACQPPSPPTSLYLCSDETRWVQIEDGWVQGIALEAPLVLAATKKEDPRNHFRAVAWSPHGQGTLHLDQNDDRQSVDLSTPQPIEAELASSMSLSADGEVILLWPRRVDPRRIGKRLLLAVADTLRFDHANADLMPGVSGYFDDGLRYTRAYSAASWTLPSMAALFTGLRPSRLRHPDGSLITIPSQYPTLATKLQQQGFATVGITANYTINHENGFSAGFESFLAPTPRGRSGQFRDAQWVAHWAREHDRWLSDLDLFLYLQFMDPHDPYRDHENGGEWTAPQSSHVPEGQLVEDLRRAYASEVRHLDRHLAPLLHDLAADRVVFTSDHGEEFFDHGGFRHGPALYPESVRVPLWIRGEGIETGDREEPVSLIDLHPLLLGEVTSLEAATSPVTMETFSFGPPRWSWVDASRQWILFARSLVPTEPETPVAQWLLDQHPSLQVLDDTSTPSPRTDPVEGTTTRHLPKALVDYFGGFRRGVFVQVPAHLQQRVELRDIDGEGWAWGLGEARLEPIEGGGWALDIQGREPFLMLFLPVAEGRVPRIVDPKTGEEMSVLDQAIELEQGLRVWLDSGRPQDNLQNTSETLERLKALGYI